MALTTAAVLLTGCSDDDDRKVDSKPALTKIAIGEQYYPIGFKEQVQNNLQFFADMVAVDFYNQLPVDTMNVYFHDTYVVDNNANTTAIALYLNILTEMERSGDSVARRRLSEALFKLEEAGRFGGLFLSDYEYENRYLVSPKDDSKRNAGKVTVGDNGQILSSLAALAGAYWQHEDAELAELAQRAHRLILATVPGWHKLYDVEENDSGLLRQGWDYQTNDYLPALADNQATNQRLGALWAVLLSGGEIPAQAFTGMTTWGTQIATDGGESLTSLVTPNGGFADAMVPGLWFDEAQLITDFSPFENFAGLHVEYAAEYGIPLLSDSFDKFGKATVYGLDSVSQSYYQHGDSNQTAIGAPYASALYGLLAPMDAVDQLSQLQTQLPAIANAAGWYSLYEYQYDEQSDSVSYLTGSKMSSLHQALFSASFFADSLRNDVEHYIVNALGADAWNDVVQLYATFGIDGLCSVEDGCQRTDR
ncbi:glucoamylase family protein [Ferrimonas pelagia]|uniref:Glucoamylase family protein n=1 Tax=Ferrimonas pelagia TaxID=1177826 RepID=A0ABP9FJP2_9GAMM